MNPQPSTAAAPGDSVSAHAMGIAGLLLALVAAYSVLLWPEWRQNPDLAHSFAAPIVFLLLVREGRRQGPWRWLPAQPWGTVLQAVCALGALLLLALAGLFAATLAWTHALVLFLLSMALVASLAAGWLLLADERLRLVPLNGIVALALLMWLLTAPIPDGTYARLTLGLQGWITGGVMIVLDILGVPARQHGNIIELARTAVGVEEACSGIRSLVSCTYVGLLFAAWLVRRPLRRAGLILAAPVLALVMNFIRSLTLTLLANAGTDIGGAWHDITGYAILGVTAVLLGVLAMKLESKEPCPPAKPPVPPPQPLPARAAAPFWAAVAAAGALGVLFLAHTRRTDANPVAAPDLAAILPARAEGWQVSTPDDLYRFSDILHTNTLLERTYLKPGDDGQLMQLTVYVAYWPPGQTSVSQVASHTPDACWPGAGWTSATTGAERRQLLAVGNGRLAPAEYRLFRTEKGYTQHVWFWHLFDGRVIDYRDPYSLPALLQIALQYGFKRHGSQYFVRISSNRPWADLAGEPLVRELAANLGRLGL